VVEEEEEEEEEEGELYFRRSGIRYIHFTMIDLVPVIFVCPNYRS
jgi:hypothetical protein